MSIRSAWEYLTEKKTAATGTTEEEHKIDETMVEMTMKRMSFLESSQCTSHMIKGMVSELVYNEHQTVINHILLPLLRQSGKENRWLLWVNPNKRLSRQWLIDAGLPLNKVVQLNQIRPIASINAMEKALASGNYSVVLGWLPELSEYQLNTLQIAAQKGITLGFIMRPQNLSHLFIAQKNRLQVHSNYYH
ncbi:SOS-induced cell division inhibitor SulA [Xenorhabdus thuongxuanensis]|uniref:Cell division inhibitor SulA n=1 Tax=Xenorhabdus thuongxuanensis TaxID=1873484 RepID=A0A1Q5U8Y8_9GAMM|nr:SOS-induced cell division inhibitor SulA [Xenorhabdus thuongxuanensis]OKP08951.1 phosphatidate cytidylyltransferase [Xenorhabdus thuongxuanensis]